MAVPVRMKPLLVLVHGTRTSKVEWDGYQELLPDVEVLAIDLPGHGDRLAEDVTYDSVVATFDEALANRKDGQAVVVAGHSLGGYLAAMYAEHLAQRGRDDLDALVLVGTTGDPSSRVAGIYKGFAKVLPSIGHERMTDIANWFYRALRISLQQPGPEAYAALADAWALVFEHCGPENLRDVTCPVVLVNGQWDQMRVHVKRFAAFLDEPEIHLIKGATHVLPMTHAEELAAILAEVAERVAVPA